MDCESFLAGDASELIESGSSLEATLTVEAESESWSLSNCDECQAVWTVDNPVELIATEICTESFVMSEEAVEILTSCTGVQGPRGLQGPPGADSGGQRSFAFEWGDATPSLLMTVNADQMILGVMLSLDVPFNGVSAALSIGDAGDDGRLLDASMVDPTIIGAFQNAPCLRFGSATQILLTIVPGVGASAGSGVVSLYLE